MNEREHEGFVARKKFKSSNEQNEQTSLGGNKDSAAVPEAGPYFLGPIVKKYVRSPVTQCLVRKKETNDHYLMKILILDDLNNSDKCSFARRTLFHNEYSILSLLKNQFGVIQLHDFFKDCIYDEAQEKNRNCKLKRMCMVLECLVPHGHHNTELIPLNHYLKEGGLSEAEALHIFYNLLLVIEALHKKNIVHRDLKLANIILNRKTLKVKLIDFYHAKLLTSENEILPSHCRTSSYSSPDKLGGQPVLPKTSDVWSAGIILYAMLNGCMPFAETSIHGSSLPANQSLSDLLVKIMENDCTVSDGTKEIFRSILCEIPQFRLKASEAVDMVSTLLALQSSSQNPSLHVESKYSDQIVPECPDFDCKDQQECGVAVNSKSGGNVPRAPEHVGSGSDAKSSKQKANKTSKFVSEDSGRISSNTSKSTQRNEWLNRKEIKFAMLRLGVTSINSINALSFNYSKKNSCRS